MLNRVKGYLQEYANLLQNEVAVRADRQTGDNDVEAAEEAIELMEKIKDIQKILRFLSNSADLKAFLDDN